MQNTNNTFDILFNGNCNSNNKGFSESLEYCQDYIKSHNGTNESYFEDYKGGMVSIICNETNETVFETQIK